MSRLIKQLTKLIPTIAVCTLLMCMLCFAAPEDETAPEAGFASGVGSASDPYVIENIEQLEFFASSVNGGNSYSGQYILLAADIELNDATDSDWTKYASAWQPIGSMDTPFAGSFDGGGHTVSGVYVDGAAYAGFFGYSCGDIRNFNIGTSYISGAAYAGGICAYSESGIIMNCTAAAQLSGGEQTQYMGGICGYNLSGAVIDCTNSGNIRGVSSIGGICGYSRDTVYNCFNSGNITATGNYVGGICGWSFVSISGGINESAVLGKSFVGGVCGVNYGNITDSRNTNTILGVAYTGGVCGYGISGARITNSYNTGKVSGTSYIGGVCGMTYASIGDCYNTSQISGYKNVGGIVGSGRDITESYNVGAVSGSGNVGGICGENYGSLVDTCYSLGAVSGVEYTGGICGYNYSVIMNTYNAGAVSGTTFVGGICGRNAGGVVATSYSASAVTGEYFVGGVIGSNSEDGIVRDNYYMAETAADSLNTSQKGIGSGASGQTNADVSGQTAGLTVAKMKTAEAFGGFDFDTVWTIKGDSTYLYPELKYASYVSGITLDKKEITLTKYNETAKLTVTVPFNLTLNTKVVWSSSNEQAVAVDQTGKVTAVGTGRAIVMAALSDGSFYATCNVSATVPELTVGESGGRPGETIRLDLTALNNPGVDSLTVKIICSSPAVTLDSVESDVFKLEGSTLTLKLDGPCAAAGKLAVLVFKISPDARLGTASVKLEVTSTADGEQTVLWKTTGGVIKINGFDRGDIDKNGKEDGEDVIALLRHLNNTEPLADTSMCDVNRDGKLNIQDVICLINHLNGTIPFETEPEPQPDTPDTPAE